VELTIPISQFRKAFDRGTMAVDVLMQEVAGETVRIAVDESTSAEDISRYARWCVEKAHAKQAIFDPFNPDGQMVCGNPHP
jgi:hypothetical protein